MRLAPDWLEAGRFEKFQVARGSNGVAKQEKIELKSGERSFLFILIHISHAKLFHNRAHN